MIAISAGHYPLKPGACDNGFCEHDEAVRWCKLIVKNLGEHKSIMVPTGTLNGKVKFINDRKPSMAVEIHFNQLRVWEDLNKNGVVDPGEMKNKGNGALTLHYPNSKVGIAIATDVQAALEDIFTTHWNGIMAGYYRMDPNNTVDFFLARTNCPAIIIEPEFIHKQDLITDKRDEACEGIANALITAKKRLHLGTS